MPETVAVPTVVPPLVQVVGALACGPKTVKVIVPEGLLPLESVALIDPLPIATEVSSVAGAPTVTPSLAALTTVEAIPEPQVLVAAELLESPL